MPIRTVAAVLALALAPVAALTGAEALAPRVPRDPEPSGFALGGDPARGAPLFAKRCALCHGAAGDAANERARTLKPPPRDLTDPAVQAALSDWALYLVIRDGAEAVGGAKTMFGWGKLATDAEIRDIAAHVRTLPAAAGRK